MPSRHGSWRELLLPHRHGDGERTGKITLDDPERATKEIKKLKFIGKDKIKAADVAIELTP